MKPEELILRMELEKHEMNLSSSLLRHYRSNHFPKDDNQYHWQHKSAKKQQK